MGTDTSNASGRTGEQGVNGGALVMRTVEGWSLGFGGDEEPRVRDLDLAARLGFAKVYKIRELISRLTNAGKLSGLEVFPAVGKTSGGRPTNEYWLTEAQALKVAAKSETDPADKLLDEMIRVFMLARRGQLPAPAAAKVPELPARTGYRLTRFPKSLLKNSFAFPLALDALVWALVDAGLDPDKAAEKLGVHDRTMATWLKRAAGAGFDAMAMAKERTLALVPASPGLPDPALLALGNAIQVAARAGDTKAMASLADAIRRLTGARS